MLSREIEGDVDPAPFGETFDIPFCGAAKTYLVQKRWMQEIGHGTDFSYRLISQCHNFRHRL